VQIYGATETGPVAIHQTIDDAMATIGSIGRCGNLCQIKLIEDNGSEVDLGEIAVKGANIFSRYWNNPTATTQALEALSTAPGVLEVAVIGVPDNTWGEAVVASVVLDTRVATSMASLQAHCQQSLAKFKQPKHYYQLNELPRNALGKIQTDPLRALIVGGEANKLG